MITFITGLVVLIVGGFGYSLICQKIFGADDRKTPAYTHNDGVDFVPMKTWKNCLIQLLNIAGTGPILGPIQGVLFGPIAFITIPLGCIIGGAFHDYMGSMISVRNGGKQMPALVNKYMGKNISAVYGFSVFAILLLVGAVFIYTPGDLITTQIIHSDSSASNYVIWIVYGLIFVYYIVATLFPIDKIIGKIYPIFGLILIVSSIAILFVLFGGNYPLDEVWTKGLLNSHPKGLTFIPTFFVTVACGIVSGFHSTQSTLISRTIKHEKEGRFVFFGMMILEGVIAMIWAAAAMGVLNAGISTVDDLYNQPMNVIGTIANNMFGSGFGILAILGAIILPITTGDTTLRALRLTLAETLHIDQSKIINRLLASFAIFSVVATVLLFAKLNNDGFAILWRYFAWFNQLLATFNFALIAVYMMRHKKPAILAIIPGTFYMFIVVSYILNIDYGLNLPLNLSYIIAGVLSAFYIIAVVHLGIRSRRELLSLNQ